ncbi:MAG TPA: porin family protein [Bacteroidales bacterium]|nr:porin family protein [Bacteroidales bacterium]HOS73468.1 porin family protein [Bacteroidales bacterium]HQH25418.1 porin family protein [Bacteroidales bacterium]HQJ83485.1 porin family protein [Bacteroidales bacterium]
MKKGSRHNILILLFLFVCITAPAQKQKPKNESWYDEKLLHFGFSIGFNSMDFRITPSQDYLRKDSLYPEVSRLNPGINIQIVTDLRTGRYWDLRFLPGVSFGQRSVRYYKVPGEKDGDPELFNVRQRLESSYLEFPLLLKYKGERLNNARPYVIGGLNFRYDLAARKEFDDEKPVYIRLKRPDLYYETGAGLDFYLRYFKLSVELKMSNGLSDIIAREGEARHPEFRNAIEKMRSQIWILAFHFE